MSLLVLSAQAAAKRKYSDYDVNQAIKNLQHTWARDASEINDICHAHSKYKEILQKTNLKKDYDYEDALVTRSSGELIDPFEKYAIEFYKGEGPIENLMKNDLSTLTKCFCRLFNIRYIEPDYYRHPDFIRHWIEHLAFNKKGTEFSNYLKKCYYLNHRKIDVKKVTQYFKIIPYDLKKEYAQVTDSEGKSALHWAAQSSDKLSIENLNALIGSIIHSFNEAEKASYLQAKDNDGNTALHILAKMVPENIASSIIPLINASNEEKKASYLQIQDTEDNTVLHILAKRGKSDDIINLLKTLKNNEDVIDCITAQNNEGNSFLHIAIKLGNNELINQIINFLNSLDLTKGEKLKYLLLLNNSMETLLDIAIKKSNRDIAIKLMNDMDKEMIATMISYRGEKRLSSLELALALKNSFLVDVLLKLSSPRDNLLSLLKDLNKILISENIDEQHIKNFLSSMPIKDRLKYILKDDLISTIRLVILKGRKDLFDLMSSLLIEEDRQEFLIKIKEEEIDVKNLKCQVAIDKFLFEDLSKLIRNTIYNGFVLPAIPGLLWIFIGSFLFIKDLFRDLDDNEIKTLFIHNEFDEDKVIILRAIYALNDTSWRWLFTGVNIYLLLLLTLGNKLPSLNKFLDKVLTIITFFLFGKALFELENWLIDVRENCIYLNDKYRVSFLSYYISKLIQNHFIF